MRTSRRATVLALVASLLLAACASGSDASDSGDSTDLGEATQVVATVDAPPDGVVESTVPGASAPDPTPDDTTDAPNADPTTESTSQPGDDSDRPTLAWAVQQPDRFSGLSPFDALDLGAYAVISQSAEYLVTLDETNTPTPGLAVEWVPNADATEWTFFLRDGVRFHDGSPFTADDVIWSLDQARSSQFVTTIESMVAVDDLTVSITTTKPSLELPVLVSDAAPQTAILRDGDAGQGDSLIGTGPFRLVDYDPEGGASFDANDDWWNGPPTVSRVDFVFVQSGQQAANALRSGEVDGIAEVSVFEHEILATDPDLVVTSVRSSNHRQIWMRTDEGPFADVRVRQAFASSIDRQELVDRLFPGTARIGNDHPFLAGQPGFDSSIPQRQKDDEFARALLAEAGFPDGVDVTLFIGDLGEIPDLAALIAEQTASAGFRIELDVRANSSFYGDVWCPNLGGDRCDGESFGIVDYGHRPIPNIFIENPLTSGGPWNSSNHADPVYDELVDRFDDASDPASAAAAASEIQRYLNDQVPVVIPYFFDPSFAHRSGVEGATVTALGQPDLARATTG